jgi:hypothetical protein
MTYSIAYLELSETAYKEIELKLIEADYHHAFLTNGVIDMSGIGIKKIENNNEEPEMSTKKDYFGMFLKTCFTIGLGLMMAVFITAVVMFFKELWA